MTTPEIDPKVARVLAGALALAEAERERRSYVARVDWAACLRGYEDGRTACSRERDEFVAPQDDIFATYEPCEECEHNRQLLRDAQQMKTARRNAINRIIRAITKM